MNLQEFGQSVKQKYPQYQSMSDEDVANSVLKKYPQYQSKIDTTQPSQPAQTPAPAKDESFLQQQFSSETPIDQAVKKIPGTFGTIAQGATSLLEAPRNLSIGGIKGALSTVQGLGKLAAQGINKVYSNFTGQDMPGIGAVASGQAAFPDYMTKSQGVAQSVGKIGEQAAEFLLPTGLETKFGEGAATLGKVAGLGAKGADLAARFIAKPLAAGASFAGIGAAQKGELPSKGDFLTGAIFQGAGELLGATWRGVKGALEDNVGKALSFTAGKDVVKSLESGVKGLTTITQLAPNITVKDTSGVLKQFDPAKADWWETAQALTQAKQLIYKQYTDAAAKAGDAGSKFVSEDFSTVSQKLDDLAKNSTADIRSAVNNVKKDFVANGWVTEEGKFNSASLSDMQDYVQNLNKSINSMSQAAKSVVSGEVSDSIRQVMDKKITSATGEAYQGLRNKYSDLLTIEKPINNQLKKALKGSVGFSSYVEGYGALDTVVASLLGNPAEAIKGAGLVSLGAGMKYLRDSENRLRWSFQQIQEALSGKTGGLGGFKSGTVVPGAGSAIMNASNPQQTAPNPSSLPTQQ